MSKCDLTSEGQQTIQTAVDASVIMTANGTTHTAEEVTVYVCDLYMIIQVQLLKEAPRYFSLGKMRAESGYSCEWHPGQLSYLIKDGRNIECKTDNHISLLVPGVQATVHQTKAVGDRKQAGTGCGRPRAKCGNKITRMASTTIRRINSEIFKFDRRISS